MITLAFFFFSFRNLSNNQLAGPIPFLPPTNDTSVVDLSNNFLSSMSSALPTDQPTDRRNLSNQLCSPVSAFNVLQNCLLNHSFLGNLCTVQSQRSSESCIAFCGTTSQLGTCSGKGVCFKNGSSPMCSCTPPFRSNQLSCKLFVMQGG